MTLLFFYFSSLRAAAGTRAVGGVAIMPEQIAFNLRFRLLRRASPAG